MNRRLTQINADLWDYSGAFIPGHPKIAREFVAGDGCPEFPSQSRGINSPAESESTLKRTVTLAGFSLLQLSALEFIPGLCRWGRAS